MRGTAVPAMAVLEMRDDAVMRQAVRGVRRNDGPEAARIDDVWLIGSDAKPMTAALIARLVDRRDGGVDEVLAVTHSWRAGLRRYCGSALSSAHSANDRIQSAARDNVQPELPKG